MNRLSTYFEEKQEIPLFGNSPPFPWELFSSELGRELGIEECTVRLKGQKWREAEEWKKGQGSHLIVQPITIAPFESPLYWMMAKTEVEKLTSRLLSGSGKKREFSSSSLQEGYYRFLLLEALYAAQMQGPIEGMTIQLNDEEAPPHEKGLCLDIEIQIEEITLQGRLVIPSSFQTAWIQHFSAFPRPFSPGRLSLKLPLSLKIQIGSIELSSQEWGNLELGDILIPDTLFQKEPLLILGNIPLFQTHLKNKELTLNHYTSEAPMDEETFLEHLDTSEQDAEKMRDIPLQIKIEIGQIGMTLGELMELSPGHVLKLPPHAENKIHLAVNGKKIGTGELIEVGETLGIRLIEI